MRRMSVLHQNSGSIGKSIPSAFEISRGRALPSGNLLGLGKYLGSQEISRVSGMDFPIPPLFWWSTDTILQCFSFAGENCVTECKIYDLLDESNVKKEELVCTQHSKTSEKVAAGGNCSLKCTDNKLESWSEPIQCGFDGDWKIPKTSLPLRCVASCDGEIFIKGKLGGSTNNLDITKEQVLTNHCKATDLHLRTISANMKEKNVFIEGKKAM